MNLIDGVYILFFSVMIFSSVLWLMVYYLNIGRVSEDPELDEFRDITFIVPAYNEEGAVSDTVESLLNLNYPSEKVDVIAVNDGSNDGTLKELEKYGNRIEIVNKENTGKADSMNVALQKVDTELVACMDADSVPSENYLKRMVGYFKDSGVSGVTPAMKLRSDSNLAEKIQWTEYIYQIFLRKVFALFDVQYVMPGPGSVYRTKFLKSSGGWDTETHTEDMEIAFRMMHEGCRLENSTNAVVKTSPPSSFSALFRQRVRWYRGYIENFVKYREMFGSPDSGNIGMFLLPLNTVWILMVVFLLFHSCFNLGKSVLQKATTFMLLGYVPLDFSFSIQQIHFFHIFIVFFLLIGVGTMILSLHTAEEPVKAVRRKLNYASFFTIYPYLFALFWVATAYHMIKSRSGIKW